MRRRHGSGESALQRATHGGGGGGGGPGIRCCDRGVVGRFSCAPSVSEGRGRGRGVCSPSEGGCLSLAQESVATFVATFFGKERNEPRREGSEQSQPKGKGRGNWELSPAAANNSYARALNSQSDGTGDGELGFSDLPSQLGQSWSLRATSSSPRSCWAGAACQSVREGESVESSRIEYLLLLACGRMDRMDGRSQRGKKDGQREEEKEKKVRWL